MTRSGEGKGLRVLSLFAGIGGFDLGLERAGMKVVAQCEIDPFCRRVLAKHWPEVPCYEDVRDLTAERLAADGVGRIDLICGGFPCQDASLAKVANGDRTGTDGDRTGLYRHIIRLAADLRPSFMLLENVPGLLSSGFGHVLGDLAALGYDAEWDCIPACLLGLPHRRDRVWIVAYPSGPGLSGSVAHHRIFQSARAALAKHGHNAADGWRSLEPRLRGLRAVHGVSLAVDRRRLKQVGNAVVPQIPEIIGRAIIAAQSQHRAEA